MPHITLAPLPHPLGVNPAYCTPNQTVLCMKEKVWSLSGDTFHIVDQNNHEVVQCRGQTFSLSDRKEFADSSGRPLFSLRARLLSIHKSFYAEAPGGATLFEVKGKFSSTSPPSPPFAALPLPFPSKSHSRYQKRQYQANVYAQSALPR